MKPVTEKKRTTADNAWGRPCTFYQQVFEIEASDAGTHRSNYGGHGQPGRTLLKSDVGRQITVYTDGTPWTFWGFNLVLQKGADHGI